MQFVHRLLELAFDDQRQHIESPADRIDNRRFVDRGRAAEHPRRHAILVAGSRMADAYPQPMKLAVADMREDVAQSVLPAVPAVVLEPRRAGRKIEIVMHDEHLAGLYLPVA